MDRAEASVRLALELEKISPGCVGDEAIEYCAKWPRFQTQEGLPRALRLAESDGAQAFDQLLAMFRLKRVREFIRESAANGPLTTAECAELEAALRDISARRKAVATGELGPTDYC